MTSTPPRDQPDLPPPPPAWRARVPASIRSHLWPSERTHYDGFLSYSWQGEADFAPIVHSTIEGHLRTWYGTRSKRLFRDLDYLPAGSHLEQELRNRLDRSEHLLVLASTAAKASRGMEMEAAHWFGSKRTGKVVIIVAAAQGGETWPQIRETMLPATLRDRLDSETVCVHIPAARRQKLLESPNDQNLRGQLVEDLRQLFLRLHAPLDWPEQRGEERRRRRKAAAALLGFVLSLVALAAWAVVERSEARRQAAEVNRGAAANWFNAVRAQSDETNDIRRALLLACKAIATAPPGDPRAPVYIARALHLVPGLPDKWLHLPVALSEELVLGDRDVRAELSPDWKFLATTSLEHKPGLWNLQTGAPVAIPARLASAGYSVYRSAGTVFSPDAKWVAAALSPAQQSPRKMEIWTWEAGSDRVRSVIEIDGLTPLSKIAFAGDSRTLVGITDNLQFGRGASAWNTETGTRLELDLTGTWPVWDPITVTGNPQHNWLLWNKEPKEGGSRLELVDLSDPSRSLMGPNCGVNGASAARFTPDGKHLFAICDDKLLHYDTDARTTETTVIDGESRISDVTPGGRRVLLAGDKMSVFDIAPLRPNPGANGMPGEGIARAAFGQDPDEVIAISDDNEVRSWNLGAAGGEHTRRLPGVAAGASKLRLNPDRTMLAAIQADGTVWFWRRSSHTLLAQSAAIAIPGSHSMVRFSRDASRLWTAYLHPGQSCCVSDWLLQEVDVRTGEPRWKQAQPVAAATPIEELPGSKWIAVNNSGHRGVALIESGTGTLVRTLPLKTAAPSAVRRNQSLISILNGTLSEAPLEASGVLKPRVMEVREDFRGFAGLGEYLIITQPGMANLRQFKLLHSADASNASATFHFWNPELARLAVLALRQSSAVSVEKDQRLLVFFSDRKAFEISPSPEGALIRDLDRNMTVDSPPALGRAENHRSAHDFLSADGQFLAVGEDDFSLRVWEVASGQPVTQTFSFESRIAGTAFDPGGDLRVATENGKLWTIPLRFEGSPQWAEIGEALTGWRAVSTGNLERLPQSEFSRMRRPFLDGLRRRPQDAGAKLMLRILEE